MHFWLQCQLRIAMFRAYCPGRWKVKIFMPIDKLYTKRTVWSECVTLNPFKFLLFGFLDIVRGDIHGQFWHFQLLTFNLNVGVRWPIERDFLPVLCCRCWNIAAILSLVLIQAEYWERFFYLFCVVDVETSLPYSAWISTCRGAWPFLKRWHRVPQETRGVPSNKLHTARLILINCIIMMMQV